MSASPVNPGDILVGKYRVEKVLGMGAMGIVIAATHLHLHQRVALKFMLASRSGAQAYHDRFMREARAASVLKTEHVTRVLEFGYLDNDAPFMVMEYLEGKDLAAVLAERGPLPIPEAVDYILQVCEAIGEAHAAGIIHRDLKPANLFLIQRPGKTPSVKVIDFGISKFEDEENRALTKTGEAMGSPLYMSPEQMKESKDVDGRADIWSLSVTLYELLAGSGNTPFFTEGGLPKLCLRVYLDAPTPLGNHRPDAPSALQAVLFHGLEKDRDRRFPNVAEFAAALAPFGSPRAGAYVERVAEALGTAIAPARPTAVLPADPSAPPAPSPLATQGTGYAAVVGSAPPSATTGSAIVRPAPASASRPATGRLVAGVAVGLVVAVLAVLAVLRWRTASAAPVAAASGTVDTVAPSVTEARVAEAPSASQMPSHPPEPPTVTPAPGGTSPAPATAPAKIEAPPIPTAKGAAAQHAPLTKTPPRPTTPAGNPYER